MPTLFASLLVKDDDSALLGVFGDERDEFCDGVVGGLLVKDDDSALLGVFGDERDEFCDGVVGGLLVLFAVVFFPRFLFFVTFRKRAEFWLKIQLSFETF